MTGSRALLALLALTLSLPIANAQLVSGSIGGRIADPTGAVVGDASVTLVQSATGFVRNTTSDAAGNFLFGGLDGGEYTLKVGKTGFKMYEQRGIMLSTGDRLLLNQTVLDHAGHWLQIEHHKLFVDLVRDFLTSDEPTTAKASGT